MPPPPLPPPPPVGEEATLLLPPPSRDGLGSPTLPDLATRHAARERHTHTKVWTKDPHGGAYRRAGPEQPRLNTSGLGAVGKITTRNLSSRREMDRLRNTHPLAPYRDPKIMEDDGHPQLGYEKIISGPTGNFVGNHMTQGAMDIIRADLARPDAASILRSLEDRQAYSPDGLLLQPLTNINKHEIQRLVPPPPPSSSITPEDMHARCILPQPPSLAFPETAPEEAARLQRLRRLLRAQRRSIVPTNQD